MSGRTYHCELDVQLSDRERDELHALVLASKLELGVEIREVDGEEYARVLRRLVAGYDARPGRPRAPVGRDLFIAEHYWLLREAGVSQKAAALNAAHVWTAGGIPLSGERVLRIAKEHTYPGGARDLARQRIKHYADDHTPQEIARGFGEACGRLAARLRSPPPGIAEMERRWARLREGAKTN